MGCGASSKPSSQAAPHTAAETSLRSIESSASKCSCIVWSAEGLRSADLVGQNEPYFVARVGPKGSTWAEKHRGIGRRSAPWTQGNDPNWNMGFSLDVTGMLCPELEVRIFDKDFLSDDFLGAAVFSLPEILKEAEGKAEGIRLQRQLTHGQGSVSISFGSEEMFEKLKDSGSFLSAFFDDMSPIGKIQSVSVDDIGGDGPMRIGTGPDLPPSLQGLYWLTDQANSSALASFGGPSRDGGGCSVGRLVNKRYKVRAAGDRVWAYADDSTSLAFVKAVDLIYHFVFDDETNPSHCQIYPELRNLGTTPPSWLLDFDMSLMKDGDERFPGSVCWRRPSSILGQEFKSAEYILVQIIDGAGQRIEPAWSKFVDYQKSAATGKSPGQIFYAEVND